ncbi:DUF6199 family natural product biosynthesis protein [Nocardiopsis salina]|uniref:DUF6199 family natural product biosynthesis protein n=1 Tax=Nocardiopsis salina TaxID=245836 RepID=UPI000349502A|nr:DUF6199 family natural product biosynthesis protein [Nocardiopsis salina]
MAGLYLLVALASLMCLAIIIRPQLLWHLSAWQYKNPEKNEPSDAWYTAQRLGAAFSLVVLLIMVSTVA